MSKYDHLGLVSYYYMYMCYVKGANGQCALL